MLKVVVDANVLVSGLLGTGPASLVLDAWSDRKFQMISSRDLLDELISVFQRPKISKRISKSDAETLVSLLEKRAVLVEPTVNIRVCRDQEDDKILAAALAAHAHVIVTGDHDLLTLNPFRGIKILNPKSFLTILDPLLDSSS